MLNLQVAGVLDRLIAEGVAVDPKCEGHDLAKFGSVIHPGVSRVELCQPGVVAAAG